MENGLVKGFSGVIYVKLIPTRIPFEFVPKKAPNPTKEDRIFSLIASRGALCLEFSPTVRTYSEGDE